MAHGLENDKSMFYVGATPWHNLGVKLTSPPSTTEALNQGGLNWTVYKDKTYLLPNIETGMYATYRYNGSNTRWNAGVPVVLGNVSERYEVLQNVDAFAPFDEVLLDHGYTYETAGAINEGRRVWILAKAPESMTVADDKIDKYVLLFNSHDGSTKVHIKPTPIRVVCTNTLNLALSKGDSLSIKHTRGVKDRLGDVVQAFKTAEGSFAKAKIHMEKMAEARHFDIDKYFENVMPSLKMRGKQEYNMTTGRKSPDKQQPIYDSLMTKFLQGKGNSGETVWDAYNAVTEWVDHEKYAGNPHWVTRTQFGHGGEVKVRAYKEAVRVSDVIA
jgi:phage/plasmid-like protein (TIGR03299 family)